MKKFKVVFLALAVASLGFVSCNDDDDNTPGNSNNPNDISGTYILTEFNTPVDTDIDGNGTSHENQAEETNCYENSKIELRGDGTVTYDYKEVVVKTDNSFDCVTKTFNGRWETIAGVGNTTAIRLTLVEEGTDNNEVINFVKEGARLTSNAPENYPIRVLNTNSIVNGPVEKVFVK